VAAVACYCDAGVIPSVGSVVHCKRCCMCVDVDVRPLVATDLHGVAPVGKCTVAPCGSHACICYGGGIPFVRSVARCKRCCMCVGADV
jgi:hypothetical protein